LVNLVNLVNLDRPVNLVNCALRYPA
jgi:hypothetical protein